MKNTINLLLLSFLMISPGFSDIPLYAGFTITQGSVKVGEKFTLALTLKALIDLPDISVIYEIPNGIDILSKSLSFRYTLSAGDTIASPIMLLIKEPGPYHITAHIIIAPKDTIYFLQRLVSDFYITSDTDKVCYSENPVEGIYYNLLSAQTIGEIPAEPPSLLTSYTLSGIVRYRNKLTNQLEPLSGILIMLITFPSGGLVAITRTNSIGFYSITAKPGQYTLIISAQNYAGEVHRFWDGLARWYGDCDLCCSPNPYSGLQR